MKNLLSLEEYQLSGSKYIFRKHISQDDLVFSGHYPGNPVFPGVLQMEVAAASAINVLSANGEQITNVKEIVKYRFNKAILPDSTITIKVDTPAQTGSDYVVDADICVDEELASSGTFIIGSVDADADGDLSSSQHEHTGCRMSIDDIKGILPHRFPFLLVDKVLDFKTGESVVGLKNVSASDYMYYGVSADYTYPRPIMLESLFQCAGILGLQLIEGNGTPLIGYVGDAKFYGDAYPGDQLILRASVVRIFSNSGIMTGSIVRNERCICKIDNIIFKLF